MDSSAREVTVEEITCVAERLALAYPYIRAQKQAEGVLGEPPLEALIRGILSQHTTDINRDRAFAALRARFPDWEMVAAAPPEELAAVIRATNHAYTKAGRIQQILHALQEAHGRPTLDFLYDWPTAQVLTYLRAFPGVGEKTAAIVCLFSLRRPVMAVDTHVHRVSQRLGWISAKTSPERAHSILQLLIPPELIFPLHVGMWEHGHTTCRPVPKCAQCAIYEFCRYPAKTAPQPMVEEAIAKTAGKMPKAA